MKKKILIFSLAYYPNHVGGAEAAIKNITDRIAPDEIEFHMVTNRFDTTLPKVEQVGNVRVHRIGFGMRSATTAKTFHPLFYIAKILFIPLAAYTAWRLNRTHQYTSFWCMMVYMSYPVALLRLFGFKKEYVLTLQEGDTFHHVFNRWYIRLFGFLLRAGINKATRIQVISTFLGDWARRMGYTGPIELVPNAVDTAHFAHVYPEEVHAPIREKLGKKPGDIFLITTSRLVKKNACDDVIMALPHLPEEVKFIILGTGPDETMLRARAKECGVAHRVQFVGFVDHVEMPKYLHVSDVFIRPSRSEGFGSSFVEAFAVGIPVIATQEGGIADFLFDPERNPDTLPTGRAVAVNDPAGIARAVKLYIDKSEETAAIVHNAKEMAFSRYEWDHIAAAMKERVF